MSPLRALIAAPAVILFAARALDAEPEGPESVAFHDYMRRHGRSYARGSSEYRERLALFARRAAEAEAHNARPGRLWTAGVNRLSDRTEEELAWLRGWFGGAARGTSAHSSGLLQRGGAGTFLGQRVRGKALPDEFMNWTSLATAVGILDQGGCGSCWAVTASTVLQLHQEIYRPKNPRTFSAQELVSCVPNPHQCGGTGGCQGATVELALNWAMDHGMALESEVPYLAANGHCSRGAAGSNGGLVETGDGHVDLEDIVRPGVHQAIATAPSRKWGMQAWERLPENGYEALLRAVAERGPVAISAAAREWSMYSGGVFDGCQKDAVIDHAVTLIGYGKDRELGKQFYLIENSWGPDWGEKGRIRILRTDGDGEWCGTDHQPELGTGCSGGPKEVRVCGMCGILYDSTLPHFERPAP